MAYKGEISVIPFKVSGHKLQLRLSFSSVTIHREKAVVLSALEFTREIYGSLRMSGI